VSRKDCRPNDFRARSNLFSPPVLTTFTYLCLPSHPPGFSVLIKHLWLLSMFLYLHNSPFLVTLLSSHIDSPWFSERANGIWCICLCIMPCFPPATFSACCLLHVGFSLCLFFNHEDGDNMSPWNIN
jgi:hypothetical protein